ncbi:MAG: SRPBCC domain-containing protein [Steroidobacteraceae bacterium]
MANQATNEAGVQSFSRIFDAPCALVWKAWTTPEYVMKWWGPKGCTSPVCRIDLRVGGRFTYSMRAPDGKVFYNGGEFREVVPLKKIVWLWYFADADGNRVSPAHYGFPDEDREGNLDEVLFEDCGNGQTKLTYTRNDPTASKEEQEGAAAGFGQILDKLAAVVAELVQAT